MHSYCGTRHYVVRLTIGSTVQEASLTGSQSVTLTGPLASGDHVTATFEAFSDAAHTKRLSGAKLERSLSNRLMPVPMRMPARYFWSGPFRVAKWASSTVAPATTGGPALPSFSATIGTRAPSWLARTRGAQRMSRRRQIERRCRTLRRAE